VEFLRYVPHSELPAHLHVIFAGPSGLTRAGPGKSPSSDGVRVGGRLQHCRA
jgi:hypothetical protein